MDNLTWAETIRFVHERARFICEYCQTSQRVIGQPMHVEHIIPNGGDAVENLCLSCAACNLSKGRATMATDPLTGQQVALYHPRQDAWSAHFRWDSSGTMVRGLTPIGRATIERFKINRPRIIEARRVWVRSGEHPPG